MALTQSEMTEQLSQAIMLIDDVRGALENEHPAIHQDLVEVRWFNTAEVQPPQEPTGDSTRHLGCAILYDLSIQPYQVPNVVGDTTK